LIEISPSEEQVKRWLLETLRHSNHVMCYSELLGLDKRDPELPHDVVGPHNKLEWDVIYGCALGYGNLDKHDPEIYELTKNSYFLHHYGQYHHRMWEGYDDGAVADDLKFGALDTICALLEKRPYFESFDSLEELRLNAHNVIRGTNRLTKLQWIEAAGKMMGGAERPAIEKIVSLEDFPNIGVRPATYERLAERMQQCLRMLREEKGYRLD
jgi:hypothetical protein